MLYLIGGIAKGGKTYLAREIMIKKGIPYFSTDFLMWSLSDQGSFKHDDPDRVVSPILLPYIEKIVAYLIKYSDDYVIEGTHVTPELVAKLMKEYPNQIRSCFMGYGSETIDHKYDEILKYGPYDGNRWYLALSEAELKAFVKEKIKESIDLEHECSNYSFRYYDVKDIAGETKKIIENLFK